jgi:hypothetical protein
VKSALLRLVVPALLGAGLSFTAGCPSPAVSKPPVEHPATGGGDLTADGMHFAISRTYKGECMPAQSRGGCYSITLEPDGQYRHVLLDAAMTGSYEIHGDQVQLTPSGDAPPSTMTLSADRTKLDDFVYQPAIEP